MAADASESVTGPATLVAPSDSLQEPGPSSLTQDSSMTFPPPLQKGLACRVWYVLRDSHGNPDILTTFSRFPIVGSVNLNVMAADRPAAGARCGGATAYMRKRSGAEDQIGNLVSVLPGKSSLNSGRRYMRTRIHNHQRPLPQPGVRGERFQISARARTRNGRLPSLCLNHLLGCLR